MSTYVMGDLHGNYYAFCKMLRNIRFSEEDTLYIIGDIIDRGSEPIKMIRRVMSTPNIKMLLGNHEDMMIKFYKKRDWYDEYLWFCNGGEATYDQFEKLLPKEQSSILDWMKKLPLTATLDINGQSYVLGHACPYSKRKEDILWLRIRPEFVSPEGDEIYICGHTPILTFNRYGEETAKIIKNIDGRIWFIDCGCAYIDDDRARLACIRLEDCKEFYCAIAQRGYYRKEEDNGT